MRGPSPSSSSKSAWPLLRLSRYSLLAAVLSAGLALSRLSPLPALRDPVTGEVPPGASLAYPASHLLLGPLSELSDLIACNSARQDIAWLAFILLGYGLFRFFILGHGSRERMAPGPVLRSLGLYLALWAGFLAWSLWLPRSGPRLVLEDMEELAVDFHSHTAHSWDGRRGFGPERNAAWHLERGFGAGFITDHNTRRGSAEGKALSRRRWALGERGYASLEGEELSLPEAHVVVLGGRAGLQGPRRGDGPEGLQRFLREAEAATGGGLAVMSLPEYWRHHRESLEALADWGARGFELVTSSPRGMDIPEPGRRRVVDLCRRKNLFMTGASDNHGYGSTACVWTVLRLPGWRELDADARERAVVETLRRGGFSATRLIVRMSLPPAPGELIWLDAPRAIAVMARAWNKTQCAVALLWLWLPAGLLFLAKRYNMVTSRL